MMNKPLALRKIESPESSASDAPAAGDAPAGDFALTVARGLSDHPRRLDSRFLYDERGSFIFERICEQPEYYLTRTEASILESAAGLIARNTGPVTLIEMGSGSSAKTQLLLLAYCREFGSARYTPVDISSAILEHARREIAASLPLVRVQPLHGTYDDAYPLLGSMAPAMMLFLGSSVGNFDAHEAAVFWERVSRNLVAGDYCLLGLDINHDEASLHAAYNDAAGYSKAFTLNVFERMNRELDAGIDTGLIDHEARYVPEWRRVEIFARFLESQRVDIAPLGCSRDIEAGATVLTEISRKFRLSQVVPYLSTFGLETEDVFTDDDRRFAVLLLRRK